MTQVQELLVMNLKRIRSRLGYSQMVLAEHAGISLGFLGDIEAGKKFPSAKSLQKIIDALGIAPYELFLGDGDCKLPRHHQSITSIEQELVSRIHGQITDVFDMHFLDSLE
jgi:transcriptional regulator with XRE-family HTH domain